MLVWLKLGFSDVNLKKFLQDPTAKAKLLARIQKRKDTVEEYMMSLRDYESTKKKSVSTKKHHIDLDKAEEEDDSVCVTLNIFFS